MKERIAWFVLASGLCLGLYWPGLVTWFAMDDFAWLGLRLSIFTWEDFLSAVFSPKAQGTIRPFSERLYFLGLERVFGLEALPFRVVAFGTQLLNLWLILRLVERMTGSRIGGALAMAVWLVNSSLAQAMSWSSAYNQILWPCLLLAACHARWTWLTTGSRSARWAEWLFFLAGFGALELQVVYPAIAGAMTLLYRRERWPDLVPLFAVGGAYAALNRMIAKPQVSTVYTLYWDSSIVSTLGTYLRMSTGIWRHDLARESAGVWLTAEVLAGFGLAVALVWLLWQRERLAAFGILWFLATLAPILPLKNHISDYYLTVPFLGLSLAAGVAASRRPILAIAPLGAYLAASGYTSRQAVDYNFDRAEQGRTLFNGIRQAAALHPGKLILLTAVSSDQYWGTMNDNPFRLVDGLRVYLAPGGDENIEKHPELGDPSRMVLAGPLTMAALDAGRAVVYSPSGGKLRNVTVLWSGLARQRWGDQLSPELDLGDATTAGQLGKGWYSIENGFRWSEGRVTLRLGPPGKAKEFFVEAFRPAEQGRRGRVELVALLGGVEAGRWALPPEHGSVSVSTALPTFLDRTKTIPVELVIEPVLLEDGPGGRKLGLVFGKVGVR